MRKIVWILLLFSYGSLCAQLKSRNSSEKKRAALQVSDDGEALILHDSGKNRLRFVYKTMYPPASVDTIYKRSGFIHPLWSPSGNVLTRVFPPDHYHHFGIWNPWAKVTVNNQVVDFWNLNKKQGTVRFAGIKQKLANKNHSGFTVLLHHVMTPADSAEIVAMEELLTVRAKTLNDSRWQMDYISELKPGSGQEVVLKTYTYGGLGFRATEIWNNQNSSITSSEQKNRKNADSTRARWCIVEGDINDTHSGVLFMSHPSNFNHPEPVRVWPENMYNRGDVFFSFSPTKTKDWNLKADKPNRLVYRMIVFDGALRPEEAEELWQKFAAERQK